MPKNMGKSSLGKIAIMCGGKGRRLGKLAKSIPKPLVRIRDKTVLQMKIERYIEQGFNEFVVCIGYKGNLIRKFVEKSAFSKMVKFSDAGDSAGILKRLHVAKESFGERILITYGDTYSNINLLKLLGTHEQNSNEGTIVVAPIASPFGLVQYDGEEKVTLFKEKPVLNYYIGYAVLNKSTFDLIPKEVIDMPDGEGLVTCFRILLAMERLGVYRYPGLHLTFNTEDELKSAKDKLVEFYTSREDL